MEDHKFCNKVLTSCCKNCVFSTYDRSLSSRSAKPSTMLSTLLFYINNKNNNNNNNNNNHRARSPSNSLSNNIHQARAPSGHLSKTHRPRALSSLNNCLVRGNKEPSATDATSNVQCLHPSILHHHAIWHLRY
uniref:Uncharacterized protein n=1 Tax=Triticum urartu TaxID=4572 RepID=A0A8R7UMP8_TRIUA